MSEDPSELENAESDAFLSKFAVAIDSVDTKRLLQLIVDQNFVLISVVDDTDGDDDDAMGAITAEVEDFDVLVAFTSEPLAGEFVDAMGDMFGDQDQVQGFIVDGEALLDYLPEDYGLLLNPETEYVALIEPDLAQQVIAKSRA